MTANKLPSLHQIAQQWAEENESVNAALTVVLPNGQLMEDWYFAVGGLALVWFQLKPDVRQSLGRLIHFIDLTDPLVVAQFSKGS